MALALGTLGRYVVAVTEYRPQPDAQTSDRIEALRNAIGEDAWEIAATLVDEDEVAHPGSWAAAGFDRGAALSEYLYEMGEGK